MAPHVIETDFGTVTGEINTKVTDPAGVHPTNIVRLADGWKLTVDWHLKGGMAGMLNGNWRLQAYLESMGPQKEPMIANRPVPFSKGIGPDPTILSYHEEIEFPPNIPKEPGVYRLVTVLTCTTPSDTPGPFAGFHQGPLLQFYIAP